MYAEPHAYDDRSKPVLSYVGHQSYVGHRGWNNEVYSNFDSRRYRFGGIVRLASLSAALLEKGIGRSTLPGRPHRHLSAAESC